MEPQWYYTLQGQQQGPIPEGQLRALIQTGQVGSNEFVFKEGMKDWAQAANCQELIGAPSSTMPAPAAAGAYSTLGDLSIGPIYQESWEIFKVSWMPLTLGMLASVMVSFFFGLFVGFFGALILPHGLTWIGEVLAQAISGPLEMGIWIVTLAAVDKRGPAVSQVFEGFQNLVPSLLLYLLVMGPIVAGSILVKISAALGFLIFLAGLVYTIPLIFAWGFLIERRCSPLEAFKLSFQVSKSNLLMIVLLGLMGIPLMLGGLICLFIGIIPAMAFLFVTYGVAFRRLVPPGSAPVSG